MKEEGKSDTTKEATSSVYFLPGILTLEYLQSVDSTSCIMVSTVKCA